MVGAAACFSAGQGAGGGEGVRGLLDNGVLGLVVCPISASAK